MALVTGWTVTDAQISSSLAKVSSFLASESLLEIHRIPPYLRLSNMHSKQHTANSMTENIFFNLEKIYKHQILGNQALNYCSLFLIQPKKVSFMEKSFCI